MYIFSFFEHHPWGERDGRKTVFESCQIGCVRAQRPCKTKKQTNSMGLSKVNRNPSFNMYINILGPASLHEAKALLTFLGFIYITAERRWQHPSAAPPSQLVPCSGVLHQPCHVLKAQSQKSLSPEHSFILKFSFNDWSISALFSGCLVRIFRYSI